MTEFLNIGQWTNDPLHQQLIIDQLKLALKSALDNVFEKASYTVIIEQASAPNQSQWETEWTAQTGRAAPILPTATLIWWDTNIDAVGGIFGTTPLSDTVVRRESRYALGGNAVIEVATATAAVTASTASINVNNSNHPSLELVLPVTCDVILTYDLYVQLASGTGTWGADFLIDGVKAGTQYLGIGTIAGIVNHATSGQLRTSLYIPNMPAGSYTIQAIMGATGTPNTAALSYGGVGTGANQYGVRTLTARGIAV